MTFFDKIINLGTFYAGACADQASDGRLATLHAPNLTGHDAAIERIRAVPGLVVERFAPIPDSAGPGKQRGGLGVELNVRADTAIQLEIALVTDGSAGLASGLDGAPTDALQLRDGMIRFYLATSEQCVAELQAGDAIVLRMAGGGGYGLSLDRPIEAVMRDVRERLVSPQAALFYYGVIIDTETLALDVHTTLKHRALLKGAMRLPRDVRDPLITEITEEAVARSQPEHRALQCILPGCCAPRIPFLSGQGADG
jgi:N-methylhydantoinase B